MSRQCGRHLRKPRPIQSFRRSASVVFVGKRSFDGADADGALRRARELIWSISVAARTTVDGWKGKSPRLWLVTRNGLAVTGDEPGDPAIGALKGLIRTWRFPGEAARVLADEPDLDATLVDLDSADDVVATLMGELDSPVSDDVIAWRQERRYVERLTRATLDAGERAAVVRADGSYIVTGGLGGLGMVVTRWLVQRGAGRLVLNGRTGPSDAVSKATLPTLANSAEIVFVPGDIAAPGVAERLVAAAEETGRPLRGVVHAAGVSADGVVAAAHPGRSGTSVGAQGGRRLAAARSDGDPTARLVGWLLFDGFASGFAGSNGVRKRERVARRPDGLATRIGSTRNHDQLGPVVGRRDEPLADVQRSGPDHSCRRYRGVGVAGGWQPHSGGCRTAAPRSRRRRHPRIPRTRLLRKGARGVRHGRASPTDRSPATGIDPQRPFRIGRRYPPRTGSANS